MLTRAGVVAAQKPISVPSGFPLTPSFNIYRQGNGTITTDYNIANDKPSYTNTIYCGSGGTNTNDGLSYANRVRSIKVAISKANALGGTIRLLIDEGYYKGSTVVSGNADSWSGFQPTCSLVIEMNATGNANGRIVSLTDVTMPAFTTTSDPNIYVSTYVAQSPSRQVLDLAATDSDGVPVVMAEVLSPADITNPWPEINAAWSAYGLGAAYLDTTNKKLYVRRAGNAAPDSNISVFGGGNGGGIQGAPAASYTIWMENIHFWGGANPFIIKATQTITHTLYAHNCGTLGGIATNGFSWTGGGGTAIKVNCYSHYAESDGHNYHGFASATDSSTCCKFIEINCKGNWNGWDGAGINNGTTCHEFAVGVHINGSYLNNADRSVHDINNTRTWDLACVASARRGLDATETSAAFAIGGSGAGTPIKWMDTCSAVTNYAGQLPQYPFISYTGCTLNYTHMTITGSNPGSGTIAAYVA